MKSLMNKSVIVLASVSALFAAHASFAGCGAVVCTTDNRACTVSSGQVYSDYLYGPHRFDAAINAATERCEVEYGAGQCVTKAYECNECTETFYNNAGVAARACD